MKKILLKGDKYALVDDYDFEILKKYKWHITGGGTGYAGRHTGYGNPIMLMHREILNLKKLEQCDHINGDSLDNRKENLRICKPSENYKNRRISINNTSGFKGAVWHKLNKKWMSQIMCDGKYIFLGYFKKKEDAAKAYNIAAGKYFGVFAKLNNLCA